MKRRDFSKKLTLAGMTGILGTPIVFSKKIPKDYLPIGLQDPNPFALFSIDKNMTVLNDRPWNIEAKAHLLNDAVTPNKYMFIRNNGIIPKNIDASTWTLVIDGESANMSKTYSLSELKSKFKHYTYQLTLECGGKWPERI